MALTPTPTTPTKILEAEVALSARVYQDNESLLHQITSVNPLVTIPVGWDFLKANNKPISAINDNHGFFAEAFTDAKDNIIIAFQGSVLPDVPVVPGDPGVIAGKPDDTTKWAKASQDADVSIMRGETPEALKDALAFTKLVMDANPNATIYLTGHSLGGAEAEYAASQLALDPHYANRVHGDTFAAPGILGALAPDKPVDTFTNYVDFGDPVGNYGGHYGQVTKLGNHGLEETTSLIDTSALFALEHRHPKDLSMLFAEVDIINHVGRHGDLSFKFDAFAALSTYHPIGQYKTDIADYIASLPPPPPPPPALLFIENFDNFGQTSSFPFQADLGQHQWFNVNNGGITTTVLQPKDSSLDLYLNTRDTQGFDLLLGHAFTDPTGGKAMLSFDFETQQGMNLNDSLNVMVDGIFAANIVKTIPAVTQPNGWQHVDIPIDTGAPNSTHTFYIWDRGLVVTPIGFGVDNIQIHDLII